MKPPSQPLKTPVSYGDDDHVWPQILAILIIGLSALSVGAFFSWPSPAIPILISNLSHIEPVTLEAASYLAVIPPISAALASMIWAVLVDIIGRKKLIVLMAIPQLFSWILIAVAKNIYVLYLARVFSGLAEAVLFSAAATYIGEIATPRVRGSWGNVLSIGIYFGQFVINVVGSLCDIPTTAYILGCLPIIQLITTSLLPESPYFLLMKERRAEAEKALRWFRWKENVNDELDSLTKDVQRQISESGTIIDVFKIPTNRKALLISIAIRGCQQFSGLPAFNIYNQYIFSLAGGNVSKELSSIIFMGLLVLVITGFAFVVDKFGRKKLMTFSSFACAIVLAIEASYCYIDQKTDIDTSNVKWVPLAGMLIYIVVCSSGLGLIPTLMLSELFSTSIKSKALCVLNICFSTYVLSVSKLFQYLTHNFGLYVPFLLFTICCLISTVFCYFFVPETKGKTLEEIQQSLGAKPLENKIKSSEKV